MKAGDYRPASEMPFKWRFAGGPIVARDKVLAGFKYKIVHLLFIHSDYTCKAVLTLTALSCKTNVENIGSSQGENDTY